MKYDPAGRLIEQQLGRKNVEFRPDQYRPDAQVGMQAAIQRRYRYDRSGQLTSIDDTRRGHIEYRYDPIGRLLAANSAMGHETFAFDPAGNIQVPNTTQQHQSIAARAPLPKVLDNLLKEYAGTSYRYDDRGNLIERMQNGQRDTFEWDAFNRMARAVTWCGITTFAYDPLGRRIAKHSQASDRTILPDTTQTMYGWDGDMLALESRSTQGREPGECTVHYLYERGTFVPLLHVTRTKALRLPSTTDVKALMAANYGKYDIALDPLWKGEYEQEAEPFGKDEIAFYQCDYLGTPQELTDHEGKVSWSAQYRAWGEARVAISEAACKAGIRNSIRFQGQYMDDETGLHYNRYRYYDPHIGRFISRDPIGLQGGLNIHLYASSPTGWIDPLGLLPSGGTPALIGGDYHPDTVAANSARNQQFYGKKCPTSHAAKAVSLGYRRTNEVSHGQPIYTNPKARSALRYISPDVDGHNVSNGWKGADTIPNLGSRRTRSGTYDEDLNRIGD